MSDYAQQLRTLIEGLATHVDMSWAPPPIYLAAFVVVAGLLMCLMGASLVRGVVVLAFISLGLWGGRELAMHLQIQPLIGLLGGAFAGGLVGFFMFRLWVGLVSAVMLTLIGFGFLAYRHALPHLGAYDPTLAVVGNGAGDTFALPSPDQHQALLNGDPSSYLGGFWDYVREQEPVVQRRGLIVLLVATLIGVTLGLLLPIFVTVIWTSLIGTLLVAGGVLWTMGHYRQDLLQSLQDRPTILWGAMAGFCLLSMMVQWLSRWRGKSAAAPSAAA